MIIENILFLVTVATNLTMYIFILMEYQLKYNNKFVALCLGFDTGIGGPSYPAGARLTPTIPARK